MMVMVMVMMVVAPRNHTDHQVMMVVVMMVAMVVVMVMILRNLHVRSLSTLVWSTGRVCRLQHGESIGDRFKQFGK